MKKYSLFILALLAAIHGMAQYYTARNRHWAFGNHAGVNFNVPAPAGIYTGIATLEGTATVSDMGGNLLFYTNGKNVYDRTGTIMPHGTSIVTMNTASTRDAAVIVPHPQDTTLFFVFSLQNFEGAPAYGGQLKWSVVDMKLNGGLGDLDTLQMGRHLADSLPEVMCAVRGNSHNVWLLTHRKNEALFLVYSITHAGISGPVVSAVGGYTGENCGAGMFRVSPDRRTIAQVNVSGPGDHIALYDFDPATGIVSDFRAFTDSLSTQPYDVEFSPNSKVLYASRPASQKIIQYDLSLPDVASISASATKVADSLQFTELRLGPDHKVYFRHKILPTYLSCIANPNALGTACTYISRAIALAPSSSCQFGMPSMVAHADTVLELPEDTATTTTAIRQSPAAISVWPNPIHQELNISANTTIQEVTIYNILGRVVYKASPHNTHATIDIACIPAGLYIVRVNNTYTYKVMRE